jgi:DegV family protein with EDD domain
MAIKIVTDSAADLPPELAERLGITVVPCYVVMDDVNYRDGVDIFADEFYDRLASSPRLPTTAQPSMADFRTVYEELTGQGHSILSIHITGKLSGTFNSAEQAKASLGDVADIRVVDSRLASVPLGLNVATAARMAGEGKSMDEVADQLDRDLAATSCFFLLDTLELLQKGGRIGKAQAFLGSILSVKPILGMHDGEVMPLERPRNLQRGIRRLAELARGAAPVKGMGVVYSTDQGMADRLRADLSDLFPESETITARFGSALGTYVGPNAVGVALVGS